MKLVCFFISAFICILTLVPATAVEYGYYEYHASENLNDIDGTSSQSIWAVGDNGLIIHYDGAQWQEEESGTAENLVSIAAVDETHAYAVGGVCLYRDESGWREIQEVSNGTKVDCISSGEAWILDREYGCMHHYNRSGWSIIDLPIKGRIATFTVLNSDDIWFLSYVKETTEMGSEKLSIYVYTYCSGELSEYFIDSFTSSELYLFNAGILAMDNKCAWICFTIKTQWMRWYNEISRLAFFDGAIWNPISSDKFYSIDGKIISDIYCGGETGVYKLTDSSVVSIEPSLEAITNIHVGDNSEYWALEGRSIRHRADWNMSKLPVGVKIVGEFIMPSYPVGGYVSASISACVQPTTGNFDAYMLVVSPSGIVYSILPGNKVVHGIYRYYRSKQPLFATLQGRIFIKSVSADKVQRPFPNGTYKISIFLLERGWRFNPYDAIGSFIGEMQSNSSIFTIK